VARLDVLEADDGDDVARLDRIDHGRSSACISTIRPMRSVFVGEGVDQRVALVDRAGVDPDEGQRAELVVHDLEGEGADRAVRVDDREVAGLVALEVDLGLRVHLGRAGR
jgi:hypothetical protein